MTPAHHNVPFQPSGVITLTTDFGLADPFVGVMKGRILQRFGTARIIDLTHAIAVHRPVEAGFWLGRSFAHFPPGTVHVAVVDPGVGSARPIAVIEADTHLFLAPDNGLLAGVLERVATQAPVLRHLDPALLQALGLDRPSHTFHGRDIFAPVAAEVASGRLPPERLGEPGARLVPGSLTPPRLEGGQVEGEVVTIDHFGNLLTNIDGALIAGLVNPVVQIGHSPGLALGRTYSDVQPGDYLALVNAFGVLEIARAEMSAAVGLGLERGATVTVRALGG